MFEDVSLPSQRTSRVVPNDGIFRILTVCTGNICRSPQAEQMLRAHIPEAFGRGSISALVVESAGTHAMVSDPMDPAAAREAVRHGIGDTSMHVARQLRQEHVQSASLVLGLAQQHRGAAAQQLPTASSRSFTLVEFAQVVEAMAKGRVEHKVDPLGPAGFAAFGHSAVEWAARMRGMALQPAASAALDIVDPYMQRRSVYARSADGIADATQRIANSLRTLATS